MRLLGWLEREAESLHPTSEKKSTEVFPETPFRKRDKGSLPLIELLTVASGRVCETAAPLGRVFLY